MKLAPKYDGEQVLSVDGFSADPMSLMVNQRERLATLLSHLDDDAWTAESRCAGWSVQDVVTHLTSTNQFWTMSFAAGLAGKPTRFLDGFDPVSSPAELVADAAKVSTSATLTDFIASNEALADAVAGAGDATWTVVAEAPPGHISLGCVALHALWDSVIHERDIALPLGLNSLIDEDELIGSLLYASSLGPAFATTHVQGRNGSVQVTATAPDISFVIDVADTVQVHFGDPRHEPVMIQGDATYLLEAFSQRAQSDNLVDTEDRWIFEGLAAAFDQ